MPQSQAATLLRHQEEEEQTKPNKRKSNKRTKRTKVSSLFPKRGNLNAKRTEKIQEQNNTKVLVMPLPNGLSYGGVLVSPNIFSRYMFFFAIKLH